MAMKKSSPYLRGLKDGLPVCFAYLAVSFTFGIAATQKGFSALFSTLLSGTNLTSAGQFSGLEMISAGVSLIELFFAVFIINSRYLLMSLSLSQKLEKNVGIAKRLFMSFFVTDEIFAITNFSKGELKTSYFLGVATTPYFGWTLGTLLGAIVNGILPPSLQTAMSIAIYCMFIAIIIPPAKKELSVFICILLSGALSCVFFYVPYIKEMSAGIKIIIVSLLSAVFCAILFPKKEGEPS